MEISRKETRFMTDKDPMSRVMLPVSFFAYISEKQKNIGNTKKFN